MGHVTLPVLQTDLSCPAVWRSLRNPWRFSPRLQEENRWMDRWAWPCSSSPCWRSWARGQDVTTGCAIARTGSSSAKTARWPRFRPTSPGSPWNCEYRRGDSCAAAICAPRTIIIFLVDWYLPGWTSSVPTKSYSKTNSPRQTLLSCGCPRRLGESLYWHLSGKASVETKGE